MGFGGACMWLVGWLVWCLVFMGGVLLVLDVI